MMIPNRLDSMSFVKSRGWILTLKCKNQAKFQSFREGRDIKMFSKLINIIDSAGGGEWVEMNFDKGLH